jgi:peroxiredoxin
MAATSSATLALGSVAPDFDLTDIRTGERVHLHDGSAAATLVVFMCNHCPYVVHILDAFVPLAHAAMERGVRVIAISSNDPSVYAEDGPEHMKNLAMSRGFRFAYCYDETQDVARSYDAQCTPDIFLFDAQRALVYHGQFDDSRPRSGVATGADLADAIERVVHGKPPRTVQHPSIGCSIKWKA